MTQSKAYCASRRNTGRKPRCARATLAGEAWISSASLEELEVRGKAMAVDGAQVAP